MRLQFALNINAVLQLREHAFFYIIWTPAFNNARRFVTAYLSSTHQSCLKPKKVILILLLRIVLEIVFIPPFGPGSDGSIVIFTITYWYHKLEKCIGPNQRKVASPIAESSGNSDRWWWHSLVRPSHSICTFHVWRVWLMRLEKSTPRRDRFSPALDMGIRATRAHKLSEVGNESHNVYAWG